MERHGPGGPAGLQNRSGRVTHGLGGSTPSPLRQQIAPQVGADRRPERLTAETGYVLPPMERSRLNRTLEQLLEVMKPAELNRRRADGAALTLEAAIEYALADG